MNPNDLIYLATRYALFHWRRMLVVSFAMGVILFLPLGLRHLAQHATERMQRRAISTPLLVGPKGSPLDLAVGGLYFRRGKNETITLADCRSLQATERASAIPLYWKHQSQGTVIVGTSLDYFSFRELRLQQGRRFAQLGECVVGASAARSQGWQVGDSLITSTNNAFRLAGDYPLKVQIVGVLEPTGEADDDVVFVDLKTAWIMDGLGHGHDEEDAQAQAANADGREGEGVREFTAALREYQEITDANRDSFHFHGDRDSFPISAVLVEPSNERSRAVLRGRYLRHDRLQMIRPTDAISTLIDAVVRVQGIAQIGMALVVVGALLLFAVLTRLSWNLRSNEREMFVALGATQRQIRMLLLAELGNMLSGGVVVALVCLYWLGQWTPELSRYVLTSW